jgi:hypothetical protein
MYKKPEMNVASKKTIDRIQKFVNTFKKFLTVIDIVLFNFFCNEYQNMWTYFPAFPNIIIKWCGKDKVKL